MPVDLQQRCLTRDHACTVVSQKQCGPTLWIMTLESPETFHCEAGQFVMVNLSDQRFFFRRPFSVLNVLPNGQFEILYKVVGEGTRQMAALPPGSTLQILGPLGKAFPNSPSFKNILLLGGGIGIAPLFWYLAQNPEINATCVYGTRNSSELAIKELLQETLPLSQRMFVTDDGSYHGEDGAGGRIDQWLQTNSDRVFANDAAFICGPMPMMRACVSVLNTIRPELPIYVSLENHMPCGTGLCSGCTVFMADGRLPQKVCVEGPVLDASLIDWQNPNGTLISNTCNAKSTKGESLCQA